MLIAVRAEVIGNDDLERTISLSNQACQECIDIGMKANTFNKTRLHHLTYTVIRKAHPELNSSLVTAVRDQASDMLKRLKLKKKPTKKIVDKYKGEHSAFIQPNIRNSGKKVIRANLLLEHKTNGKIIARHDPKETAKVIMKLI